MQRIAFKMKLHEGQMAEYKKRHDDLWLDLRDMLKSVGICEYSIFLDEETHILFAFLKINDPNALDDLPNQEVVKRWWAYMSDIMDTNPDNSPVQKPLTEVFYLL